VLRSELGAASAMARRFVLEAQAVNRVQHPNIVQVFDLVQETPQEGGRIWFVMELLEGQSLKALAHDAPIDLPRVVRFMRQAAEALSAAHAVGVVHRDLKPDNLFVANDTLKVLDFGVAQVRDLNSQAAEIPRTTQVGQVVGTPLWMAPEQILGKDVDARADVYGLATVMYVLLLRKFPFSGAAMTEIVMQRLEHDARPPGNFTFLGEVLPPELSQLLTQCLSRDVAGRPPMSAVALRLSKLEHALADGADDDARASPRQWRRWALAAAAFAGAAGAAWLRLHSL
jgi:serine/threonine-protein kinase